MKKSLAISVVTLLVITALTGIVLAKQDQKGALAITTDPSNVSVSISNGGLIVEKYSPFWTGDLTPGRYIVTANFTNPTKVVSETVTVIAGRTVPVHLSAKAHEELPFEMRLEVDKTKIKPGEAAIITITLLNISSGKPLNQPCVVNLSTTLGNLVNSVEVVGTAQVTFTSATAGTATVTAKTRVGSKGLEESVVVTVVNPIMWTVMYEANEMPTEADPPWTASESNNLCFVSNGILFARPTGGGPEIGYYRLNILASNSVGNMMKFRAKVTKGNSLPGLPVGIAGSISLSNAHMHIYEDHIKLFIEDEGFEDTYTMDTTDDFHIYKITYKNDYAELYVDGILRLTTTKVTANPETHISFYTLGSYPIEGCETQWDYVRYYTGGF